MLNKKNMFVLAAGAILVGLLTIAASNEGQGQYKLGGAFIGSPARSGGIHWSAFQAPLDPAGKTAALRVNTYSYGANLAGLLAFSGADTATEGIGQAAMISKDTAKASLVFYGVKQGNPPQVKQIWAWEGTLKFTGPDTYDVEGEFIIYDAATADADGDGRPDPGAAPLFPFSIPTSLGVTRVLP